MGPIRRIITNWKTYFVVYFQITSVLWRHSSVLVNKNCAFYVNELSISITALQLLAPPLTKWNLPVPCNISRETRCTFQNWNRIFLTSELSFTQGFMNELMTDWWQMIINNILPLPKSILDYLFKLTLNHQGPYNSKMNKYWGKLIMYACITRETFVLTVFHRVFHSILKLELCWHACRCRDQINILTCRYEKNMPTTALVIQTCIEEWLSCNSVYVHSENEDVGLLILAINMLWLGTCIEEWLFCNSLCTFRKWKCESPILGHLSYSVVGLVCTWSNWPLPMSTMHIFVLSLEKCTVLFFKI